MYETCKGYLKSNLHLFLATDLEGGDNVGVGESSCMQGSVTWLIALYVNHHITGHLLFVLVSYWVIYDVSCDW
jgi:hypothetical protein